MEEDFNLWNKVKINTHLSERKPVYFHEREIWWCQLGINIGQEENGKDSRFERPVLVLQKITRRLAFVVPLTSASSNTSFCVSVGLIDQRQAKVILAQTRTVDAKRFSNRVTILDEKIFAKIKTVAKEFLFP